MFVSAIEGTFCVLNHINHTIIKQSNFSNQLIVIMFMCVIFEHSKVLKVVPQHWQQNNQDPAHRIRPNERRKIFYSWNKSTIPNFELPLSTAFDEYKDGCYYGYILTINGKLVSNKFQANKIIYLTSFQRQELLLRST